MNRWWLSLVAVGVLSGCGVTVSGNESSGVIVNVQREGSMTATWDLYLLHGTSQISEKQSELFSLNPDDPSLARIAQEYADRGQRVRLTYMHYGFRNCWPLLLGQINSCDVVTAVAAIP